MSTTPIDIVRLIQGSRFDLSTEKHLQADMELVFKESGLVFEREKRLSASDIPDFLMAGGVVVECKMKNKSRKIEIFRQLSRYAEYQGVTSIILATNVSMGLPEQINGKPVFFASVSRGWM